MFVVDIEIPEELKILFDDLPLSLINTDSINPSPHGGQADSANKGTAQQKLIAAHLDLCGYCMVLELLQFYLKMGCRLTKVHSIISYEQKPIFKPFIEHCVNKRKEAKHNPPMAKMYKNLACSVYGKTIQSDRKYATKSILCHLDDLDKHLADPKFKSIRQVGRECFCITKNVGSIQLKSPIYIGACILQYAKLVNFKFHYLLAKPSGSNFPQEYIICDSKLDRDLIDYSRKFLKSVKMIYCDTDSFIYEVVASQKGLTFDFIVSNLFFSKHMDRSNFETLDKMEGTYEEQGLGRFKSEIKDRIGIEIIIPNPKSYSFETAPMRDTKTQSQQHQHLTDGKQAVADSTNNELASMVVDENNMKRLETDIHVVTRNVMEQAQKLQDNEHIFRNNDQNECHVYKTVLKGCPKKIVKKAFPHRVFKKLLIKAVRNYKGNNDGENNDRNVVNIRQIRYDPKLKTMVTLGLKKDPLQMRDTKRYYINPIYSVAYGHPASWEMGFRTGDILTSQGGYIKDTKHMIPPTARNVRDIYDQDMYGQEEEEDEESGEEEDSEDLTQIITQALSDSETETDYIHHEDMLNMVESCNEEDEGVTSYPIC